MSSVPLLSAKHGGVDDALRTRGARDAFQERDLEASRNAHDRFAISTMSEGELRKRAEHNEPDSQEGRFVKPMVFGGLDGISTMFSLIAGSVGAGVSLAHMVAIGVGNLIAGAFGMGFGEYVSSKAERELAMREEAREAWEAQNYPEGEIAEMVMLYMQRGGLTKDDAVTVATTLSKYKDFWVEHMMLTEVGLFPVDKDENVALSGIAMFMSFLFFGCIPLLSYCIFMLVVEDASSGDAFTCTAAASLCTLFILGAVKSHLTEQGKLKGGLMMLLQGALSAGASFYLGDIIQHALEKAGLH